jgi:hypothetical protein
MNDQIEQETLEDVLDAYVASAAGPDSASLDAWIHRYPQFATELTEFAASWSLMKGLPAAPDAHETDVEKLVLRGMGIVQNLLHAQGQERVTAGAALAPAAVQAVAIESLIGAGRDRGLAPSQLARAAGIGEILLRKLDRRLIAFARLPREASEALVEALAAALEQATETVERYLQQRPVLGAAAYRAEQAPQLAEPEDFFEAVRNDPTITDEQRARWLAFDRQAGR